MQLKSGLAVLLVISLLSFRECVAQDSLTNPSAIVKISTSANSSHYKIIARIGLDSNKIDSSFNLRILFTKEASATDTCIVLYEFSAPQIHANIKFINPSDILPEDTVQSKIVNYRLYNLDYSEELPNKQKVYLLRIEIFIDSMIALKKPKLQFIGLIKAPKVEHGEIERMSPEWKNNYTPTELIYRIAPGVPR